MDLVARERDVRKGKARRRPRRHLPAEHSPTFPAHRTERSRAVTRFPRGYRMDQMDQVRPSGDIISSPHDSSEGGHISPHTHTRDPDSSRDPELTSPPGVGSRAKRAGHPTPTLFTRWFWFSRIFPPKKPMSRRPSRLRKGQTAKTRNDPLSLSSWRMSGSFTKSRPIQPAREESQWDEVRGFESHGGWLQRPGFVVPTGGSSAEPSIALDPGLWEGGRAVTRAL